MLELLAIASVLAVGSLPPLEPMVKQKAEVAEPLALPPGKDAPAKKDAGPAKKDAAEAKKDAAQANKDPGEAKKDASPAAAKVEARPGKSGSAAPVDSGAAASAQVSPEAKPAHAGRADAAGKAGGGKAEGKPGEPAVEAPSEELQHAAAPALAPGAICEELRRASRDRREERARIAAEREALLKERTRLETISEEIAQARQALREETVRLQGLLDKAAALPAQGAGGRGGPAKGGTPPARPSASTPPASGAGTLADAAHARK